MDSSLLPTNVKPTHYDICIKTDLRNLIFEGLVKVQLDVKEETSTITLNSRDLELGYVFLFSSALNEELGPLPPLFDTVQERVSFAVPRNLVLPAASKAELKLTFKGHISSLDIGYHRSSWQSNGKTEHCAATFFQSWKPNYARRAFPSWDEPNLKATFKVTLVSRSNTVSLSNMHALSESPLLSLQDNEMAFMFPGLGNADGDWKITHFDITPPMSTYSLAFANGHFAFLEQSVTMPRSEKTIPVRFYSTPDILNQVSFALEVTSCVLPVYEDMFDVNYPLQKLDTLVINNAVGAMENWGLIIGSAEYYLLDPDCSGMMAKNRIISGTSHEVAHQWFGNITTMNSWKYLYLNEGFATLMGSLIATREVYSEFGLGPNFINEMLTQALESDSRPSSHPVEVDGQDPDRIVQIFDALSYAKAASVLRMLCHFVGEESFLRGVSLYLKSHLFGNTVTEDLWRGISTATGLDIDHLMHNWINKSGYPVLKVAETSTTIHVQQDRFIESGPLQVEYKDDQTIWNVPLAVISANSDGAVKIDNLLLQRREQAYDFDTHKSFKLNAGTSGLYRVLYTRERLMKIAIDATKNGSVFSVEDRMGLISDELACAKAGLTKITDAFDLIQLFKDGKEYSVWATIATGLAEIQSIWWEYPKILKNLDHFIKALFYSLVDKLGYESFPDEPPEIIRLRIVAVEMAANAEDPRVVAELCKRFASFLETGCSLSPDLEGAIYKVAVSHGDLKEYERVFKIHENPTTPSSGRAARIALGSARNMSLLQRTMNIILSGSRQGDAGDVINGLTSNPRGKRLISDFFMDNYDALGPSQLPLFFIEADYIRYSIDILKAAFSKLSSDRDLRCVEEFFQEIDTSQYDMALQQALDSIRSSIAYVERDTEALSRWLENWTA